MAVGLSQQLRRGAVARSARRRLGSEQRSQGPLLAASIRDHIGVGNLLPELPGTLGAQVLELGPARVECSQGRCEDLTFLVVRRLQPPAFHVIGAALLPERVKRRTSLRVSHVPIGQASARFVPAVAVFFMARTQRGGGGGVARGQLVKARTQRDGLGTLEQLGMAFVERVQLGLDQRARTRRERLGSKSGGANPSTCQRPSSMPENPRR